MNMSFFKGRTVPLVLSRDIMAPGKLSALELTDFFYTENPNIPKNEVYSLASFYVYEGLQEGVNYSLAFAQMCLETGYLKFGNLVTKEMNNFCGLGAMDSEHPGESFPTVQIGVRAHIQHLQAYGTTEEVKLKQELVDPRYAWVHKTKYTKDVWGLSGTWATDPNYAKKIDAIMQKLEEFCSSHY